MNEWKINTLVDAYAPREITASDLEDAYRRGYCDGFIAAAEQMINSSGSKRQAYDMMWNHWQGPLANWRHDKNKDGCFLPPALEGKK